MLLVRLHFKPASRHASARVPPALVVPGGAGRGNAEGAEGRARLERMLLQALRSNMQANFGDKEAGLALASLAVRAGDLELGTAVVRCSAKQCREVRASLTLMTAINAMPVVVQTLAVCGSARTLEIERRRVARRAMQASAVTKGSKNRAARPRAHVSN